MFTPIGFFAPAGGAIPHVDLATVFYDSGETTDFTDQSGNDRNGTESTSAGGSITHNAGAAPYWHFDRTSDSSRIRVSSGYTIPNYAMSTYQSTAITVYKKIASTADNTFPWFYSGSPSQNPQWGVSRALEGHAPFFRPWAANNKNGLNPGSPDLFDDEWKFIVWRYDYTETDEMEIFVNNSRVAFKSSPVTSGTTQATEALHIGHGSAFDEWHLGACGFFHGTSLTTDQMTDIYNYYDAIYSFA